jgi:hypothetical protein
VHGDSGQRIGSAVGPRPHLSPRHRHTFLWNRKGFGIPSHALDDSAASHELGFAIAHEREPSLFGIVDLKGFIAQYQAII